MSTDLIERARTGDEDAFGELVDPYRRDLQLHCYRILGSIHDAEDALQETLLAAWQGLSRFEGRSSIRTWLHRIATNRCLNMPRAGSRRPKADTLMPELELPEPTRLGEVLLRAELVAHRSAGLRAAELAALDEDGRSTVTGR